MLFGVTAVENTSLENIRFCACSCGTKIPALDKKGRPVFYAKGHRQPSKTKAMLKQMGFEKLSLPEILEKYAEMNDTFEYMSKNYKENIDKLKQELETKDQYIRDLQELINQEIPELHNIEVMN